MAVRASAQKLLAVGREHGTFFFGSVALVASVVGGAIAATKYADQLKLHNEQLKKDLEHERQLRKEGLEHERELRKEVEKRFEQRIDLLLKNQLFDILHHADYEAAASKLNRSEATPAERPSTD